MLRALREARGVTLAGWGARLGVSRTTVQRWERGERAPDPGAESAILAYCHEADLFRTYTRGPLAGLVLTAEVLRDLLAEARWRVSGQSAAPARSSPRLEGPATDAALPRGPWPSPVPSTLPAQLTSFVGREQEIAGVRRVQAGTRLLTLTGAGGCGKTRLALELARELMWAYADGIWLAELGDRLGLLTGGSRTALPRHQTLRAALDWSYDLLAVPEQALLCGLAVFAGGFTLEAAEALGEPRPEPGAAPTRRVTVPVEDVFDVLSQLVDKSLVVSEEHDGGVRCRMLETVRQYAAEHLEAHGDAATVRERHLAWGLALAHAAQAAYRGPGEPASLSQLDREHDNLRAALGSALAQGKGEAALRLAVALPRFWALRGHLPEGRQWLTLALAAAADPPAGLRAEALHGTGMLAYMQGDYAAARALFEDSLELYRELDHGHGMAEAQGNLGRAALRQGDFPAVTTSGPGWPS